MLFFERGQKFLKQNVSFSAVTYKNEYIVMR